MNCLFCQIIQRDIPANIVYENEQVLAFDDIAPQAPKHILIIPKKHITTICDIQDEDTLLMGQLVQTAKNIAKTIGIDEQGYRLVFNCKDFGGQLVDHIHLHLLAGRKMQWPPG